MDINLKFKFENINRDIDQMVNKNRNVLSSLGTEYFKEKAELKKYYELEIAQAQALEIDCEDIYDQMYKNLIACANEYLMKIKIQDLKQPAKPRKKKWRDYQAFCTSGGTLGIKPKVKEYRAQLEEEMEQKTMDKIFELYEEAYQAKYKELCAENKQKLKSILKMTDNKGDD